MKKPILLILSIVGLIVLVILARQITGKRGHSDSELIGFNIEDTSKIDKIEIIDPQSTSITLIRKNGRWTDESGGCVSKSNVNYILEAAHLIEFKGYLAKNSKVKFTELMSTQHTKVTFFENGKQSKIWYIGPPAQDHYGQIMLLETPEGKSKEPVMMRIKGLNGIISPRFFADKRKWMCTEIFSLDMTEIKSVDVKYADPNEASFSIKIMTNGVDVRSKGKKLSQLDTANVYRYLQGYKNVHFNLANFELSPKQCDSLKRTIPFCTLTLETLEEKIRLKTTIKMHQIKTETPQKDELGEMVNVDMNVFWAELNNGNLVKCQYFVFNPLIMGDIYFPALIEEIKKGE